MADTFALSWHEKKNRKCRQMVGGDEVLKHEREGRRQGGWAEAGSWHPAEARGFGGRRT